MKSITIKVILTINIFIISNVIKAQETHADIIISEILKTKNAIVNNADNSNDDFIFLSFWDFDGTILKGDCSEGLYEGNEQIYKGLAQLAIEKGCSQIYSEGDFDKFWKDYKYLEHNIGRWLAYPFIPQMLRGSRVDDIRYLSEQYFESTLSNYYFSSSLRILDALKKNDIRNYIISASADIFVDGAASTLGLSRDRFHGIEIEVRNNLITENLVYPVTWAEGKTEKLKSILQRTANKNPGKKVVALAAFGNSYNTDGPFMKYIAEQNLSEGKPVSVMINGGAAPGKYNNLFFEVQQSDVYMNRKP